jgi:hypothetical protein
MIFCRYHRYFQSCYWEIYYVLRSISWIHKLLVKAFVTNSFPIPENILCFILFKGLSSTYDMNSWYISKQDLGTIIKDVQYLHTNPPDFARHQILKLPDHDQNPQTVRNAKTQSRHFALSTEMYVHKILAQKLKHLLGRNIDYNLLICSGLKSKTNPRSNYQEQREPAK